MDTNSSKKSNKKLFYILLAILGIVALVLFSGNSGFLM